MAKYKAMLAMAIAAVAMVAMIPAASAASSATSEVTKDKRLVVVGRCVHRRHSTLVRTENGVQARFAAKELTPGDAVTLWVITFNHPKACSTTPCSIPADVFNEAAGADFYWAAGKVVGDNGRVVLSGRLDVGQTDYSGKVEVGIGDAVPLDNPYGAEVVLATHSHGPAATGAEL